LPARTRTAALCAMAAWAASRTATTGRGAGENLIEAARAAAAGLTTAKAGVDATKLIDVDIGRVLSTRQDPKRSKWVEL